MEDYTMLMPFKDESENFVHGFECGQIWEKMNCNNAFDKHLFHTCNSEQIEMMCRRFHYTCTIEKIDDDWSYLFAELNKALAN